MSRAVARIASPIGAVGVVSGDCGVEAVGFDGGLLDARYGPLLPGDPHGAAARLARWFNDARTPLLDLPVDPAGTPFQLKVWEALRDIPSGSTVSYGTLASWVGSVARAVGSANGANPVAILLPCHRVVGADGALVGYGGGLDRKRWLLAHEGALPAEQLQLW